jgi:hypothetical protein
MLRRLLTFVLIAVPVVLVSACETKLPKEQYPAMRFQNEPPIIVDVGRIEIVEKYTPPLAAPNVEHEVPLSPASVMRNWAQDRLQATGRGGVARFIITDASVVGEELKKPGGIKGAVTRSQDEKFTATLKARLEIDTAGGLGTGFAEAFVGRSQTVPENMTLKERDEKLYGFIKAAGKDFDDEMELNIRRHLGPFLK